jgi:hypothetical protein
MARQFALIAASALILVGCGAGPTGLSSAGMAAKNGQASVLKRSPKADAKDPFAALEIVAIESQLLLCPCFTLKARAGSTTVMVDFEGDSAPLTVNRVDIDGEEADETQLAALRPALEKAAAKMKNKQQAAQAKLVAKAL